MIWFMIIVTAQWQDMPTRGQTSAAVVVEFATRDACVKAQQFVARRPTTQEAYCIPSDRKVRK